MKTDVLGIKGEKKGTLELPEQFNEAFRPDLIKRAAYAVNSKKIQVYGSKPDAGKRSSAKLSRRRRDYKTAYGHSISRVPRKIMSRRGTRFNWVAAFAPGTVGGRPAHPPKIEHIKAVDINDKERKKAIRCAISACFMKDVVEKKQKVPEKYPFILANDFENIKKTKDLVTALESMGFGEELERASEKRIRAGRGKNRGRRYKRKIGPLIIVSKECDVKKIKGIPGVDVTEVKMLNAAELAPGNEAGRITLFTEDAVNKMKEDKLFL